MLLVCKGCGELFEHKSKRGSKPRFCSRNCKLGRTGEFKCDYCGVLFTAYHKRKYCSSKCREKGCKELAKVLKPCGFCGNKFLARDGRHRFCSVQCGNQGKNKSKGRLLIACGTCPNCGDEF